MKISENLKTFLSDSFIYTLLNIINKAIPFLLLPIIVRMLSAEDFGLYSLFIIVESLLIPLVSLNLHAALSSHFYLDNFKLPEYLSTIIYSLLAFSFISVLFSFLLPATLTDLLGLSSGFFKLAILSSSLTGIIGMISSLFRLQRKPWRYGVFSIAQSLLLFILIYLFCIINPTFYYIVFGRVLYVVLFFVLCIIFLVKKKYLLFLFRNKIFKRAFKFSLPTVVYSLSAFVFLSSDRFFIKYFLGTESVGFYSAIFQLSSVISILGMSLNAAWMPWLFENLKKNDYDIKVFIIKLSYLLIILTIVLGIIMILIFPFFARIILPEIYHKYIYISTPIIFGFVFEIIYLIVSPYLFYAEKTKYNAYIGVMIAFINVMLNITLLPYYGIFGSALATCVSWMLLAISFFVFSNRVYPMPWLYFLSRNKN